MRRDKPQLKYWERPPTSELHAWVESLWCFEGDAAPLHSDPFLVVPDGCPEVIVHYRRSFVRIQGGRTIAESAAFVFGQLTEPIELVRRGPIGVVGARLRPEALCLLGIGDASQVTGGTLPLIDLGKDGRAVATRVGEAVDPAGRFRALENFLIRRVGRHSRDTTIESAAVARIRKTRGLESVDETSSAVGISRRQLERRFRATVGISPKRLAMVERFGHVLEATPGRGAFDGADLAVAHGYYDQSHLWRDFRSFAGRSASEFMTANTELAARFAQSRRDVEPPAPSRLVGPPQGGTEKADDSLHLTTRCRGSR